MEPKFKLGDKVIVCGSLKTVIIEINPMNEVELSRCKTNEETTDGYSYWFLDEKGRRWKENSYVIKKQ